MRVLIYKRTHKGDPDEKGIFGIQDCMGRIRNWNYDAVIGIGGRVPWKEDTDIKHKINWIGLEPHKIKTKEMRGDYVVFTHFELYEAGGINILNNFPNLFEYMYGSRKRFDMSSDLPEPVFKEVEQILNSIKNSPSSEEYAVKNIDALESEMLFHSAKSNGCFGGKHVEITIDENAEC